MKQFLSLVLSACLLVNTAAPAFAQLTPLGESAVRATAQGASRQSLFLPATLSRHVFNGTITAAYLARIPSFTVQSGVPTEIQLISSQFQNNQFLGLGAQILKLPQSSYSLALMRNQMVGLALKHRLPGFERGQAIGFYQEQLAQAPQIFSMVGKGETLESFSQRVLKTENSPEEKVFGLFADAAALGLMGNEKDIPSLFDFYKAAKGTIFESPAKLLLGRSLQRMGKEAESKLKSLFEEDAQDISWETFRNQITELTNQAPDASVASPSFQKGLLRYGPFAGLAGDFSTSATFTWRSLGEKEDFRVVPSPAPKHGVAGKAGGPVEPLVLALPPSSLTEEITPAVTKPVATAPVTVEQAVAEQVVPAQEESATVSQRFKQFLSGKKGERTSFPVSVVSKSGEKRALPITFSIGSSFKGDYDEIIFQEEPRFENGYIVKRVENGEKPVDMEHFYMSISPKDIGTLVRAAQKAGVNLNLKLEQDSDASLERVKKELYDEKTGEELPVELDVQLSLALWRREAKQAFSHWLESLGLPGVQSENLILNAQFFLRENGEIGLKFEGSDEMVPLPEEYYVRFPKHQLQQFMKLEPFLEKGTQLEFVVHPTEDKVDIVARDASLSNVSLGKVGSIVRDPLEISDATANALMFSINYVMPGFASLMTPVLKKYGEKNLLVTAMGISALAGALITAGGFYGFVEQMTLGPVQKGLFMTGMVAMAVAGIIKQLVSNPLINGNRGVVVLSSEEAEEAVEELTEGKPEGFKLIAQRFKEIFLRKPTVSLTAVAGYNRSFIYKNVGTLAFLGSPYLINYIVKFLSGVDLGLDFSVSFPLYALYATYVMQKVMGSKLRDAYTAKKLNESRQTVLNMIDTGSEALAKEKEVSQKIIRDVARSFKDSLDALAFAHIKIDPSKDKKILYEDFKDKVLTAVENKLIQEYKKTPEEAKQIMERLSDAIKMQENNLGNMWAMFRSPGVATLLIAMSTACVHEFVLSSSFTGIMKNLIPQGELALFLTASALYLPMIAGRLAGGDLSNRKMKPASMYIGFSALSAIGTTIMATAGGSVPLTIAGAAIATIGIGNFFTQMYDYITRLYPKRVRELSSLMALTMGVGGAVAIPAGYMAGMSGMGVPANLLYASGMLLTSLLLTPRMMRNSSLVTGVRQEIQKVWERFKRFFHRGGDTPGEGPTEGPTPSPAQ